MNVSIEFSWNRLRERLWFKPLVASVLSVCGAFVAKSLDVSALGNHLPDIQPETNKTLLSIMASSMLVIATFAVASMVSAYASASNTATPRSFPLVVADDVSQNALSSFIGAFIFSIVSLVAVTNDYYGNAGQFVVFALTMLVFTWVVLTFVRWVDQIARLGRLGNVIEKVESATAASLERRHRHPALGARPLTEDPGGKPVYSDQVGYVQQIDVGALQTVAEQNEIEIAVAALPGTFVTPDQPLAIVAGDPGEPQPLRDAFRIGDSRVFDDDPRCGLVVLSEIAARALSPAVNDPGTAIDIIGTFVRLFADWVEPLEEENDEEIRYERITVPTLSISDMFDDAFTSIARDGAGIIEVQIRLQKAFRALDALDDDRLSAAAMKHSARALDRASGKLQLDEEIEALRDIAIAPAGADGRNQ
jgi:uncharacterized membrane protein